MTVIMTKQIRTKGKLELVQVWTEFENKQSFKDVAQGPGRDRSHNFLVIWI